MSFDETLQKTNDLLSELIKAKDILKETLRKNGVEMEGVTLEGYPEKIRELETFEPLIDGDEPIFEITSDVEKIDCFAFSTITKGTFPNAKIVADNAFSESDIQILDFGKVESFGVNALFKCAAFETLIIRTDKVCTTNAPFYGTKIEAKQGFVYVPDHLVASYKTAAKWSVIASQIKPLSEYEGAIE